MLPVECVVRGYITGSGWKDYQATGAVSGIELPPGLRESEQLPQPIFTPSTKADVGHDEAIDFDRAAELVGDRALMERVRDDLDRAVLLRRRPRPRARRDPRRHQVRVRPRPRRRAGRRRRGADARLLALLAGGRLRGRPRPAELRQAVRARLGLASGWDKKPPAPPIPDEVVAGTRARYVEAYELIVGEPFRAWLERTGTRSACAMQRARVLIRPKAGILDPQGAAVERALPALGFAGVANVHVGRLVELDVEDSSQLDSMCERLLANPLVEDYETSSCCS